MSDVNKLSISKILTISSRLYSFIAQLTSRTGATIQNQGENIHFTERFL